MRTFDLDQFWPSLPVRSPDAVGARDGWLVAVETDNGTAVRPARAFDTPSPDARSPDESYRSMIAPQGLGLDVAPPVYDHTPAQRIALELARRGLSALRFMRGFDPKAAIWLTMGFMTGMVSWHAVGFWGFVSATVLNGPGKTSIAANDSAPARPLVNFKSIVTTSSGTPASDITTGSLATFSPQPALCVALVADRATGVTSATPCGADNQAMRDAGRRRRSDRMAGVEVRLQNAGSWATDTQAETPDASAATAETKAETKAQTNTLSATDFDLTLTPD